MHSINKVGAPNAGDEPRERERESSQRDEERRSFFKGSWICSVCSMLRAAHTARNHYGAQEITVPNVPNGDMGSYSIAFQAVDRPETVGVGCFDAGALDLSSRGHLNRRRLPDAS